jgi:hypothetical protein
VPGAATGATSALEQHDGHDESMRRLAPRRLVDHQLAIV